MLRRLSGLLNSPAAKEMARRRIGKVDAEPEQASERLAFLRPMEDLGVR
ncbi:hypothetical protein [Streptomyces virginiae]|nr:hypothetical protein [Streptomyces virginiae]MCX5180961.1 hypothetical protein [Streptomyces virginiae]